MEAQVGDIYRTKFAVWTVESVSSDSMIRFRRDDGLIAWFGAKDFAGWVIEKLGEEK